MFTIIALIVAVLIKIITFLGVGALLALVVWAAVLMLRAILAKVQELLKRKVGGKVTVMAAAPIVAEINKEIARKGNVYELEQLKQQLKDEDIIAVRTNEKDEIETTDDLVIMKGDKTEKKVKDLMEKNEGALIITN